MGRTAELVQFIEMQIRLFRTFARTCRENGRAADSPLNREIEFGRSLAYDTCADALEFVLTDNAFRTGTDP